MVAGLSRGTGAQCSRCRGTTELQACMSRLLGLDMGRCSMGLWRREALSDWWRSALGVAGGASLDRREGYLRRMEKAPSWAVSPQMLCTTGVDFCPE